ncbi:hypothetical protein [Pandoraea fibrosis]|uniref:Uncharacterized protein n=1 Tax=Pandoraea fibrosis TaxID=1891094 RepID=A0A5E4SR14_9BURK|nr:hypothetical protein [Pandoraea fibrosis]QHE91848.1 hypothetical protein PJ20_008515 [Pandoraea fibrosis]QHF14595.1 hypothetical protein PI93_019485 [Pandoraea fibrosis]VVD76734.1 hypothetical protein PFI31113_00890 [Pandoraea fibrosis]
MPEDAWYAVLEHALAMHEGEYISACHGPTTLLLERRADVLIAMREISSNVGDIASFAAQMHLTTDLSHCQILSFGDARYLCVWRRRPVNADWLAALATADF